MKLLMYNRKCEEINYSAFNINLLENWIRMGKGERTKGNKILHQYRYTKVKYPPDI